MVDIAAHRSRAPRPPGPDRRRHVVDDRNVRSITSHALGHPMGEFGAVDDDQNIRLQRDDTCSCLPDAMQINPETRQYLAEADNRRLVERKLTDKPLTCHLSAADPEELDSAFS